MLNIISFERKHFWCVHFLWFIRYFSNFFHMFILFDFSILVHLFTFVHFFRVYQLNITFRLIGLGQTSSNTTLTPELSTDPCEEQSDHGGQQMVWWDIYTALSLQCLCYLNSTINPVLYALISDNFKQSYKKAWCCHVAIPHLRQSIYNHTRIPEARDRVSVTYKSGKLESKLPPNTILEPDTPLWIIFTPRMIYSVRFW